MTGSIFWRDTLKTNARYQCNSIPSVAPSLCQTSYYLPQNHSLLRYIPGEVWLVRLLHKWLRHTLWMSHISGTLALASRGDNACFNDVNARDVYFHSISTHNFKNHYNAIVQIKQHFYVTAGTATKWNVRNILKEILNRLKQWNAVIK